MTTAVDVSYNDDASMGSRPFTLDLMYQGSKVGHPGSSTVILDENPKQVKMYDRPVAVFVDNGAQRLDFALPSPFRWKKPERHEDSVHRGWAITEKGKLMFFFAESGGEISEH